MEKMEEIKIDVYVSKLPNDCYNCPCFDGYLFCNLMDDDKNYEIPETGRLPDCPLKEIRELMNEKNNQKCVESLVWIFDFACVWVLYFYDLRK